ncbi:hypothetical protein CLHOM_01770 [Clostridium homopropionicum DSM 5847]|uniref:Uncharacterized protein n=1 Tax=Clostridium homopropionicum DSM 5847 TaxID=1121318 RepID=A0A0L6ZEV5_9CLOT|nr:hypothetical protein [Clostridium homopropionicum]KOA21506.1 hypothetical protein CLHOM_01770 [Clostridium homopropionicum DSM 5847]SFG07458.1 hypothetical protein SAMN04488501_10544 [Clostridium homopropionicum]
MCLFDIPDKFITPMISATAVIIGSLIGATCSWITMKHSIKENMNVENKIVEDNRKYEEIQKMSKICENINIIRLDICTAIFQSIRNLNDFSKENYLSMNPILLNRDYSKIVASLTNRFDLKEMSYIYQLYGIIEIINEHIKNYKLNDNNSYNLIIRDCELLLHKIYGDNYKSILKMDIDKIKYEQLYDNQIIKIGYKKILKKLDENVCTDK